MKRIAYLMAMLAIAACAKEMTAPEVAPGPQTYPVSIKAGFDPETRTAYADGKVFSWVEGDKLGALVQKDGDIQIITLTAQASGPVVEFTGEMPQGYSWEGHATYPYTQTFSGYANNDCVYDPAHKKTVDQQEVAAPGYRIYGSIKPGDAPLSSIPLIGIKDEGENNFFQFKTAVGVLKFTVKNVPIATAIGYMETPDAATAPLNGWFSLDQDGFLKMSNATDGYKDRYCWSAPTEYNQTMEFYFYTPVGTIPAGSKFELCDANFSALKSFEIKQPIEVVRNKVIEVEPVEVDAVTVYDLSAIVGEYEMTASTIASWFTPTYQQTGNVVFAASDNNDKGNVMITRFAGVEGKAYGNFDGVFLSFPFQQIFGDNPFANSTDWPKIALINHSGNGNIAPLFKVVADDTIEYCSEGDYYNIGLRPTSEEKWTEDGSFNGAWPWAVGYHTLTLEKVKEPSWQSLGTGRFRDNYIWGLAAMTDYVQVDFQQDVNHPKNFRIAKPYPGEKSDEWFVLNISNPDAVTSEPYFLDFEVTSSAEKTFKPWIRNGDYGYNFSDVMTWQESGLPATIEIGPCYRGEEFDAGEGNNYDYEIGKDHDVRLIEIIFPGCEAVSLSGDLSEVVGDYNVDYVDFWGATGVTTISIATSDNTEKGNIMVAEFSGHTVGESPCAYTYGTYADGVITLPDPTQQAPFYIDGNGAKHCLANYNGGDVTFTVLAPGYFISNMWIVGNRWATESGSGFDTFWTSYKARRK